MQVFLAIQQAGSGNGIGFALILFFLRTADVL